MYNTARCSSQSSLNEKTTTEQKIADILLANNAILLSLICQTYFVGDTAATVSVGVLSLLRRQRKSLTEIFLKRLMCGRIEEFLRKNRDLNDIIRDNSMATMLLNAYARYEGLSYLSKCLTEPMQSVLATIEKCELDPQKLPENREDLRLENEANLKEAALKFLESILRSKAMMPPALKNMCFFLHTTLEMIISGNHHGVAITSTTSSPLARSPMNNLETTQEQDIQQPQQQLKLESSTLIGDAFLIPSTRLEPVEGSPSAGPELMGVNSDEAGGDNTNNNNLTQSTSQHNSLGRLFGKRHTKTGGGHSVDESHSISSPTKGLDSSNPSAGQKDRVGSTGSYSVAAVGVTRSRSDSAPRAKFGFRDSPKMSRPQSLCANEAAAVAATAAGSSISSPSSSSTSSSLKSHEDVRSGGGSGGRSKSEPPLLRPTTTLTINSAARRARSNSDMGKHIDINTLLSVKEATSYVIPVNTNSLGVLSVPEKIVGSFLFLRFFVPAITSPDNYGLLDKKVSSEGRRGLVLIGKILTALCNDVEFGNKENYLIGLNVFLKDNREKVKEFLNFVSSMPPTPADDEEHFKLPDSNSSSISSVNQQEDRPSPTTTSSSPKKSNNLAKQAASNLSKSKFSASLPSLVMKQSNSYTTAPTAPLARTRSTDLAEDADNFYSYLGKSLAKIEKDL